jgi:excisionase family DNA binding protein
MSATTEETIWVRAGDAARRLNVQASTVYDWVRTGRLKARKVSGHGAGGKVLEVCEASLLVLAAGRREHIVRRAAGASKVKSGTCRAGLEPDAMDSANPCDAVAATLDHTGLVFTSADYAELTRRRGLFERLKGVSRAA